MTMYQVPKLQKFANTTRRHYGASPDGDVRHQMALVVGVIEITAQLPRYVTPQIVKTNYMEMNCVNLTAIKHWCVDVTATSKQMLPCPLWLITRHGYSE